MSKSPTQNPQRPSALSLCPKGDDNTRSKLKSPKMVTIADPPAVCYDQVGSLTLFSLVDFLTGDCTTEVTPGWCPCFFVLAEATYSTTGLKFLEVTVSSQKPFKGPRFI